MSRLATPKLGAYLGLAAAGFLAALLLGRPEAAVLALPFALLALLGLASVREPRLELEAALGRDRVVEGEPVELALTVRAETPVAGLEVRTASRRFLLDLSAGEETALVTELRPPRWGVHQPAPVRLRARDSFGFLLFERTVPLDLVLRVYPRPEQLRALLAPLETQVHAGNTLSRTRGSGIEFADVRPFAPGDRVRHVNWRVSARHRELHVNQQHPERNADVVIFLDTFAEAGTGGAGGGTLDLAIRGAAGLAARYLERRDRVGLVAFGGILRWLRPGMGTVQLYRLMDSLLDTRVVASYAWKDLDVIPAGMLPPQALVLALSPLLDERSIGALLDIRGRGFDVAVLELDPAVYAEARPDPRGRLAHRLWLLRREALRERFRAARIPVAAWSPGRPVEVALEEVRWSRRRTSRLRA